jgi:hypothetical protein
MCDREANSTMRGAITDLRVPSAPLVRHPEQVEREMFAFLPPKEALINAKMRWFAA